MMQRMLFLFTNLSVVLLFGIIVGLFVGNSSNLIKLMVISGIFGFFGSFISLLLSKSIALSSVRGVIINNETINNLESWLLEIIKIQSRKKNIISPQLAVYDSLDINAFATGPNKNSALIAISTGLLNKMSRKSIEAVIAHEISHIAHGDMVTMTLIQGIINTFVIFVSRSIAQIIVYCISCFNKSNNSEENIQINECDCFDIKYSLVYSVISFVLEIFFGIIASIIVFWFSRNREFYADANASKLVGRDQMISALKELKGYCENSKILASEMETLCFNINKKKRETKNFFVFRELFVSHPSLEKRIMALQYNVYLNGFSSLFFHID